MIKKLLAAVALLGLILNFTACAPLHDEDAVDEEPLEETLDEDDENGED